MFLEDLDKEKIFHNVDTFERLKPFQPKKGTTNGEWYHMQTDDNDSKFKYSGAEGDTYYTEPPDSNFGPAIDHRISEETIWAFNINSFGLPIYNVNEWIADPFIALKWNYQPHWKGKLSAPDYVTQDKIDMFKF